MRNLLLWTAAAGLLLAGCASRGPGGIHSAGSGSQSLFRVEAAGADGDVRLRLMLRRESRSRFQLAAADLLGRTVWSLAVDGGKTTFADHRHRTVCRGPATGRLLLPLLGLDLPPGATVAVLLGEVPVPLPAAAPAGGGTVRFGDEHGQQWEVTLGADGRPTAWKLAAAGGRDRHLAGGAGGSGAAARGCGARGALAAGLDRAASRRLEPGATAGRFPGGRV
ncbi:MAG: hypothetical protein M5U13_06250 [Thermoanaerobaculia bacterium]|nr:hypothetical protein [Thermoanaerobaculia bacterium]